MKSDEDLHFSSEEERRKYLSDLVRLKRIREEEKRRAEADTRDDYDDEPEDFDFSELGENYDAEEGFSDNRGYNNYRNEGYYYDKGNVNNYPDNRSYDNAYSNRKRRNVSKSRYNKNRNNTDNPRSSTNSRGYNSSEHRRNNSNYNIPGNSRSSRTGNNRYNNSDYTNNYYTNNPNFNPRYNNQNPNYRGNPNNNFNSDQINPGRRQKRSDAAFYNSGAAPQPYDGAGDFKKKKKKKRNILFRLILLILLAFIGYFAYNYFTRQKGYYTVAIFGVDSRDGNVDKGLSDVNIICNINRATGDVQLVSVYRDTYAQIDEKGTFHKINEAYFRGGAKQAVPALERNLDLKIEDYATFNWKAVADGINILGGVDLEITEPEFKYINSFITFTVEGTGIPSKHLEHPGMNHLDGVQAVAYSRLRLMDTDYNRTERQRRVISLAFDKAKQADFATLKKLVETVLPQTATSLTLDDLIPFITNLKKYHLTDTTGFPFDKAGANIGPKDCVVPVTLKSNVIALHKLLYKDDMYIPSPTLESINKKIIQDSGLGRDKNDTTPSLDNNNNGGIGPRDTQPAQSSAESADINKKESQENKISKENEADERAKQSSIQESVERESLNKASSAKEKESSINKASSTSETIEQKPDETTRSRKESPSIIEDDEPDTTEAGPGNIKEPSPEAIDNQAPGE